MAKTKLKKYSIQNLKYSILTGDVYGPPIDLAYAVSISLESDFDETKLYGDGEIIGVLADDKGKTGTLVVTNIEDDYEIACGRSLLISDGVADIGQRKHVQHAIYYEVLGTENGVTKVFKHWLYNLYTGKPNETYQQTEDNPTLNNYEYSLTILGTNLRNLLDTADFIDAEGNKTKVFRVNSKPTDANYATFGDSVPSPNSLV